MLLQTSQKIKTNRPVPHSALLSIAPDLSRAFELKIEDESETLRFLNVRPVHTIVMASFILDNGIESKLNRGKFYGYRNANGELEAIALIGHTTLVEARSDESLKALALVARRSRTPIHLIMSSSNAAEDFWRYYGDGFHEPRLTCTEFLFEVGFPFPVPHCDLEVRPAQSAELTEIAEAHASIAFMESSVDPMQKDREGFMNRVLRRIEQNRVYVVYEGDKLVFKADIIAETADVIYLEGIYVAPEYRGKGIGSSCLAKLTLHLLKRVQNVCLLSNINFIDAHMTYLKAGFRHTDSCTTLFT
jgi:GNAT superfamily N-acetyltransferase